MHYIGGASVAIIPLHKSQKHNAEQISPMSSWAGPIN